MPNLVICESMSSSECHSSFFICYLNCKDEIIEKRINMIIVIFVEICAKQRLVCVCVCQTPHSASHF